MSYRKIIVRCFFVIRPLALIILSDRQSHRIRVQLNDSVVRLGGVGITGVGCSGFRSQLRTGIVVFTHTCL